MTISNPYLVILESIAFDSPTFCAFKATCGSRFSDAVNLPTSTASYDWNWRHPQWHLSPADWQDNGTEQNVSHSYLAIVKFINLLWTIANSTPHYLFIVYFLNFSFELYPPMSFPFENRLAASWPHPQWVPRPMIPLDHSGDEFQQAYWTYWPQTSSEDGSEGS